MVWRGVAVTLPLLLVLLLHLTGCIGQASQRSFDELVQECADLLSICPSRLASLRCGLLPEDAETKCLIRCVGVNGRFWSDQTGLRQNVLASYFSVYCGDPQHANRTQVCLDGVAGAAGAPQQDCCELAFRSFLCYYHNYGNLHRNRVFVPLDQLQLLHVAARCMEVQRNTVEDLMSLSPAEMDANASVHCLVRCIGIRTGLYSDRYGVNIDLLYAQYGEGHDEVRYKADAYACVAKYGETGDTPCRRAYQVLYKCFENVRNVITEYELPDSGEC